MKYDLEERTEKFGKETVAFCKSVVLTTISKPIISQLIRSGTSVGANYMEANGADSKKDFKAKISICKKEAKETMYWLKILLEVEPKKEEIANKLWQEAHELSLIFGAINRKP